MLRNENIPGMRQEHADDDADVALPMALPWGLHFTKSHGDFPPWGETDLKVQLRFKCKSNLVGAYSWRLMPGLKLRVRGSRCSWSLGLLAALSPACGALLSTPWRSH